MARLYRYIGRRQGLWQVKDQISKIDEIMDGQYNVAVEKGRDIKEATRRLTK